MEGLLKGKNVVITGAHRGIGRAIVEVFAENGANAWVCLRKADPDYESFLERLASQYQVELWPVYFDLMNAESLKVAANQILASQKPVDVLVNNAGAIFTSLFQMTSLEKQREMFEINYFAQVQFTQYMVKAMVKQKRGSIINFSSSAAIEGNEGRVAYASAKAAINTASRVMARELGPQGIRVNTIAPGLTETEMMISSTPENAKQATVQRTCLRRTADPKEIASAALFLASDLSSYLTGQVLRVDGGM